MKKFVAILMVLTMMIGLVGVTAFADGGAVIVGSTDATVVAPGGTFTVVYSLTSNPNVGGLTLDFSGNSGLSVDSITGYNMYAIEIPNSSTGRIVCMAMGGGQSTTGPVACVTYRVTKNSNGTVNAGGVVVEAVNGELNPVGGSITGCTVTVKVDPATCKHSWGEPFEVTPATCTTDGSYKHTCAYCEKTETVKEEALGHDMEHHTAVNPGTCTENGNVEYWYCKTCKNYFLDKDGKSATTAEDVVIPASHLNLKHEAAKAESCTEDGNIEYWHCTSCNKYFSDAACKTEISAKDVVIPAAHKGLKEFGDEPVTCTKDGRIRFWYCPTCNKFFSDAACQNEITEKDTKIPAHHLTLSHTTAVAPTCTEDGNIEYWYCSTCEKYFSDADCKNEIQAKNTVDPATGHDMEHHAAVTPGTCTENGNVEYWYCKTCKNYFLDKDGKTATTAEDVVIPAGHLNLKHETAKAESCTEDGNIEYWHCTSCGRYFSDEACKNEITQEQTVIKAHHLTLSHVTAVAPTCTEDGNVEYWSCSTCGKYFSDGACENEIAEEDTVEPATGHVMEHHVANEATCLVNGNVEHWYCKTCKNYYLDKDGKTATTQAETIIAMLGHDWDNGEITKDPSFTEAGEKTYHCKRADCDGVKKETIPMLAYKFTSGDGASWTEGSSNALAFTTDGDNSLVQSVTVNGKTVDVKTSGDEQKTSFELSAYILKELSVGSHKVEVTYSNGGHCTATITVKAVEAPADSQSNSGKKAPSAPKTGDESHPVLWISMSTVALVLIVALLIIGKKKRATQN